MPRYARFPGLSPYFSIPFFICALAEFCLCVFHSYSFSLHYEKGPNMTYEYYITVRDIFHYIFQIVDTPFQNSSNF